MSSVIENIDNGTSYNKRIHMKGASEIVMECCDKIINANGEVVPLGDEMRSTL